MHKNIKTVKNIKIRFLNCYKKHLKNIFYIYDINCENFTARSVHTKFYTYVCITVPCSLCVVYLHWQSR